MNIFPDRKLSIVLLVFCFYTSFALAQTFKTLASLDASTGTNPIFVTPIQGPDGYLYGTTYYGGTGYGGTFFKVSPDGALKVVYNFNSVEGVDPAAGVIFSEDGDFYGTAEQGGNGGSVYRVTRSGTFTPLYRFCSQYQCSDGQYPSATVLKAHDGNFYGTTNSGGTYRFQCDNVGCGTVFRLTPGGILTTLYDFGLDTALPYAGLVEGPDGDLYGTTNGFFGNIGGTIFKITLSGTLTTLHTFTGEDGSNPIGALTLGTDGNFYGTTSLGGTGVVGGGTIFKITPSGDLTSLYSFCVSHNCPDGEAPFDGLVEGTDGNFYGTTVEGGQSGSGTIFKITPTGVFTSLYSFCQQPSCTDGETPEGGLVQATDGNFYGVTNVGGSYGEGAIYRLSMGLKPFVAFVRRYGWAGQNGGILGQGFTRTTSVTLNGTPMSFSVVSDTFIKATVPSGATTGYVTVTTPSATLTSSVPFHVIP